ncbi:MAG: hypothetical protein RMK30_04520 [Anaerolineae bacterium]|nr:hypothetical protein [Anaerolineae bacterium]
MPTMNSIALLFPLENEWQIYVMELKWRCRRPVGVVTPFGEEEPRRGPHV